MSCRFRGRSKDISASIAHLGRTFGGVTNRMGRTQNGVIGALIGGAPAQFVRFCVVGGAGYVTNLVTFAPLVHYAHTPTLIAACIAYACGWVVALIGHRHWTFAQRDVSVIGQGLRYLVVSCIVLGADLVLLQLLVTSGIEAVLAQAVALAIVTPLSFGLNRLWAFGAR
jgi:putative flippase GtrA